MMRRLVLPMLFLLASLVISPTLRAEPTDKLIAPSVANRYGLERAWFTQIRLGPASRGIVDVRLHVSTTSAQTLFRVVSQQGPTYTFSDRDLDIFGDRLGEDGAGKAAAEKARTLRLRGIESQIDKAVVPDIRLFVTTGDGLIHAIDAETGNSLWITPVGTIDFPTTVPAVTENNLAVVNGQTLYVLDTNNGNVISERRVTGGPSAGPMLLGNIAYVPLLDGKLKAFRFGPGSKWWPETYYSSSTIHVQPTAAGQYLVWANEAGTISIITAGRVGVRHRMRLDEPPAGPIIFVPPQQLLCVTVSGYIYSFDVENAQLLWRYASGDVSAQPVAVVGDLVFLMTRHHGIHAISTKTGLRVWPASYEGASKFLAATNDRVYCTNEFGNLVTLDAKTGHVEGRIPLNLTDYMFANNVTDRIYVATRDGAMQCLHEMGAQLPTLHLTEPLPEPPGDDESPAEPKTKEEPSDEPAEPAEPAEPRNPFESAGSPFDG